MLLFLDGMAHYDTSRIGAKWSTVDNHLCTWTVVGEGRFGNCLKRVSTAAGGVSGYLTVSPLTTRLAGWVPTASGVCGFAVKVDDLNKIKDIGSGSTDGYDFFAVWEGTLPHVKVQLNKNGTFTLRGYNGVGSSNILLAVSSEGLTAGTWMYVEFKWLIHPTAGTFEIRVNGITVLTFTGNTKCQGGTTLSVWNSVLLLSTQAAVGSAPLLTFWMCDFYLADLAFADSDDIHDFQGDGVVGAIYPNAPGASGGWLASSGANWDATNDKPLPDDDGTYVRAVTSGSKDLYNFEDIPTGSVVKGIQVSLMAKRETEGATTLAPIVHPTTVDYAATPQGVTSLAYDRYVTQTWDLNPETMAPWTDSDINNGQYGFVKVL